MSSEEMQSGAAEEMKEDYAMKIAGMSEYEKNLSSSSAQNIWEQVGNGFLDPFESEVRKALSTRVVGYEFPDKHKGYIVETGGVVAVHENDEVLLPYIRHCYVIKAGFVSEGTPSEIIMHHGPTWENIPLFIAALKGKGDVLDITLIANSHFQHGENSAPMVSTKIGNQTGIPTKGVELNTNDGRSLQLLIKNSRGTLLTLDKNVSQEDYDTIQYKSSKEILL